MGSFRGINKHDMRGCVCVGGWMEVDEGSFRAVNITLSRFEMAFKVYEDFLMNLQRQLRPQPRSCALFTIT